jgi:hypothetical protein
MKRKKQTTQEACLLPPEVIYSPKRGGENLALSGQEFIMISFLTHPDIIRFNQAFFDSSFLPLRS